MERFGGGVVMVMYSAMGKTIVMYSGGLCGELSGRVVRDGFAQRREGDGQLPASFVPDLGFLVAIPYTQIHAPSSPPFSPHSTPTLTRRATSLRCSTGSDTAGKGESRGRPDPAL